VSDYYPLIAGAVDDLDSNTREMRDAVYHRARAAQTAHLRQSGFAESEIEGERQSLERAIQRVESEANSQKTLQVQFATDQAILKPENETAAPQQSPSPLVNLLRSPTVANDSGKPKNERAPFGIVRNVGGAILGIVALVAMATLAFFFMYGGVWLSEQAVEYMLWFSEITFVLWTLILLPLSLFRTTRPASTFGSFVALYIFGITTWMLGVLITYDYLGTLWLIVGFVFAGVGVVPLGIIGAIIKADWQAVGALACGIILTYGSRTFALWLSSKKRNIV
jgi:hypothetical protein